MKIKDLLRDSLKNFLFIYRLNKGATVLNFVFIIVQAVLPMLSLVILKNIIDKVTHSGFSWTYAVPQLICFGALQLASGILQQFSGYNSAIQQHELTDYISEKILHKTIKLEIEHFENPEVTDELYMARQQALTRPAMVFSAYQGLFQNLVNLMIFSGFLILEQWYLLLLIILFSLPTLLNKLNFGYQQYLLDKNNLQANKRMTDLFHYLTVDQYAKEVRIFGFGPAFISQFRHLKLSVFKKRKQLQIRYLSRNMWFQLFEIVSITVVYAVLIGSAVNGIITMGGLVIYFQIFQRLQAAMSGFYLSTISLFQSQLFFNQIISYLALPTKVSEKKELKQPDQFRKGISVRNLDFIYPGTSRKILSGINLDIQPSKLTAIVGENGSGKSTLLKLLCGLYEPAINTVFWDDSDITEFEASEVRKEVTMVFQDFGKYYLSLQENIAPGVHHADPDLLDQVICQAELEDVLNEFPDGMKTQLGRTYKRGIQLSGGQWQKLAIARMFYKQAKLMILDEPTSMMDPMAESEIFRNLKKDIGDRIIVLVTHRLYNLKMADVIYVMHEGKIVECGTFDELLSADGHFRAIYEKQKL